MKILKMTFIISILLLNTIDVACSQDTIVKNEQSKYNQIEFPNIVKVNSLAMLFNNVSLVYERGIIPRVSAGIGVGYKYGGSEPKLISVNSALINADIETIKGITITPEFRYYLRACDPNQLDGFYAGIYFRYTGYKTKADFQYIPLLNPAESYGSDISLKEYGAGIQLGYQMIIKKRLTLDFLFFGPRFSNYTMSYEFTEAPSQEFLDDLSDHLNEIVDRFGLDYNVDIKKQGESSARTSFSFANMRFGFSLGFAF